jgi:hypothetical protein
MVNRSELFSKMVQNSGHAYQFETRIKRPAEVLAWPGITVPDDQETETDVKHKSLATRLNEDHDDIEDILYNNEELTSPESQGILEWLTTVYRASRGFELGTFDPSLLAITMKEQSKKWDSIALGYISDVVTIVHNFVTELLRVICPDERVRNGLTSLLIDGLLERYKKAIAQVEFILQVERSEKPATQNHYFNDTLEKWYAPSSLRPQPSSNLSQSARTDAPSDVREVIQRLHPRHRRPSRGCHESPPDEQHRAYGSGSP